MKKLLFLFPLIAAPGCERSLAVNVDGSFLPSWMLCLTVGSLAGVLVYRLVLRYGLEDRVAPALLFYPSVVIAISCLIWLFFFR